MAILLLALIAVIVLACSGCAVRSFEDGKGVKYSSVTLGTTQSIGAASIPTANGPATVTGFSSEQAQVMSAIVTAAVTAAVREREAVAQKPADR